MTFTTTLVDLKALATQQKHGKRQWAEVFIKKLEMALWRGKAKPGAAIALAQVRAIVGVEFALWCLPAAQSSHRERSVDRAGRLIACFLTHPVLETWLPEAVLLSDGRIGPGYGIDLGRDIIDARRPLSDWHGWLLDVEGMLEENDGSYNGCLLNAALSSSKSMLVESLLTRRQLPSPRRLTGQGRFCAASAYFDACWAWAISTTGYRAAHEIVDLARAADVDGDDLNALNQRLDMLRSDFIDRADAVVKPYAEAGFEKFIVEAR